METLRIIEHGNGHTDIEALVFGEWVVVKCIDSNQTGETTMSIRTDTKEIETKSVMSEPVQIDLKRFQEAYEDLIDETDNPLTHRNRNKNQRLNDLLELFEYLRGEDEESPITKWFSEDFPR